MKCSSRSSNWNNSPLNLNSNNGSRRVTDTADMNNIAESYGLLADPFTSLRNCKKLIAKYTATDFRRLVGKPKVCENIYKVERR